MAFTGTPVVTTVARNLARITGVRLVDGATGTISLAEGAGEVKLNADIQWSPYAGDDEGDNLVDLEEACQASFVFVTDPGTDSAQVAVTKSGGGDPAQFLISFENFGPSESATADMEIYIRFH
jgi:hypothetical protein